MGFIPTTPQRLAGWRIDFTWYGLPKAWWPLTAADLTPSRSGAVEIVYHDHDLIERFPCQSVVRTRKGGIVSGPRLQDALDIMFR